MVPTSSFGGGKWQAAMWHTLGADGLQQAAMQHTLGADGLQQATMQHTLGADGLRQAAMLHTLGADGLRQAAKWHTPSYSKIKEQGLGADRIVCGKRPCHRLLLEMAATYFGLR